MDADLERRFGGLRRLYGDAGYHRIRTAHVAVIGLGGVGSWAVEALARSGVAELTLIDLDHVSESNINRQVQALGATVGQSKAQALRDRIADIHPGCLVNVVEEFVDASNWPELLKLPVSAVIDACDQVRAKAVVAAWAVSIGMPCVSVGAAGGKQRAQCVEVADLVDVTHDALLASLRQRLRHHHEGARKGPMSVRCVFSKEVVATPTGSDDLTAQPLATDGTLNCHGYGSSVSVTATFGMVAAGEVLSFLAHGSKEQTQQADPIVPKTQI